MEAEVLEPETALALVPHDARFATRPPKEVLDKARDAAIALKEVILHKKRPVIFRGEQYLQFEDWQTVGGFFGCSVATGDAELVEIDGVRGFRAKARVIDANGIEVSAAEAYCMKDEDNWANKPLFQLASMAQTRSGAKALRNKFAWVAVLAGYSPTPAEEMTEREDGNHAPAVNDVPKCPECGGAMWDNRTTKKGKQPDFKCKDKSCDKAIWLQKTEGFGTDAALRDELFNQAEKLLSGLTEQKRKDALGRLVLLSTDDMGKKVNELAENARKKAGVKPDVNRERAKKIMEIEKDADPKQLDAYLAEHFPDKGLGDLDLDALVQVHAEFVVPF